MSADPAMESYIPEASSNGQNDVKDYADYVVKVGTRESSLEKYDPNDGENREEYKDDPAKQRALDQKRTQPIKIITTISQSIMIFAKNCYTPTKRAIFACYRSKYPLIL